MKRKRIGELYDKALFVPAFEAAAEGLVSKVMGEFADTDKGRVAREQAVENLKKQIKEVPVEYYRTLEAFINGEDVTKYARFTRSEAELEYFKSTHRKGLIDLIAAHKDGSWVVKNVAEDEKYYELRFEGEKRGRENAGKANETKNAAPTADTAALRRMAEEQARERLTSFDFEARKIRRKRVATYKAIKREHAAFISEKSDIDRRDPAYRLLGGLYSEFKREYKTLSRMEDMVMRARRRLIPLEAAAEHGAADERSLVRYNALKEREVTLTRDLECYMNALDELNEVRYKNGIISKQLYLRKAGDKLGKPTRPTPEAEAEQTKPERVELSLGQKAHGRTEAADEKNPVGKDDREIDKK